MVQRESNPKGSASTGSPVVPAHGPLRDPVMMRGLAIVGALIAITALSGAWHESIPASVRFDKWIVVLVALGSAFAALVASRRLSLERVQGWQLIAVGAGFWAIVAAADALATRDGAGFDSTTPTRYLALVPLWVIGIRRVARPINAALVRVRLDVALLGLTVAVAEFAFIIGPLLDRGYVASRTVMTWMHVVGNVALAVVVSATVLHAGNRLLTPAHRMLVVATLALVVGDALIIRSWNRLPHSPDWAGNALMAGAFGAMALAAMGERRQGHIGIDWSVPRRQIDLMSLRSRSTVSILAGMLLTAIAAWSAWDGDAGNTHTVILVMALFGLAAVVLTMGRALDQAILLTQQLGQKADRDSLTGLLNHRSAYEHLQHVLRVGHEAGAPVAVALIDVDDFKLVNDTWGHQTGDAVLRQLAGILEGVCRATDIAARYAGDEFILILPDVDDVGAHGIAERMMGELADLTYVMPSGARIEICWSVGIAVTSRCGLDATWMVAVADAAMYDAKGSGKNRAMLVNADSLVADAIPIIGRNSPPKSGTGLAGPAGEPRLSHRDA